MGSGLIGILPDNFPVVWECTHFSEFSCLQSMWGHLFESADCVIGVLFVLALIIALVIWACPSLSFLLGVLGRIFSCFLGCEE